MDTFTVNIYTPERFFGTFEVLSLTCEGLDGQICIMRGHMPMLLAVKAGRMKLRMGDSEIRTILTDDGTVFVENNVVKVFTDICEWEEDGTGDIAERIARRHEQDKESVRIHRQHEIKLARIMSEVKTRPKEQ